MKNYKVELNVLSVMRGDGPEYGCMFETRGPVIPRLMTSYLFTKLTGHVIDLDKCQYQTSKMKKVSQTRCIFIKQV